MDDPIEQCGNDLRFIEWWLIHHGKQIGDPADKQIVSELAQLTQGVVQVLVSRQLSNRGLSREFEAESARVLTSAAGRLANANQFAAA
jgi:hypothetical protein